MKKNFSDYLIALAVIVCSLSLLAALTFALGGWKGRSGRTLLVDFADVTGLKLHAGVRYAGAPAGTITELRHLTPEERNALPPEQQKNTVRVSVELAKTLPELPNDVTVSISSDTLLSDKFIALSPGTATAPRLANGTQLQGTSGGSIDELLTALGPFLENAQSAIGGIEPLLKKTAEAVDAVKAGVNDVLPRVSVVADSLTKTSASADALLVRADKLIADNEGEIKADLVELRGTLSKMQDTFKTADGLLTNTDRNLGARMRELGVVLQNLKVVSTHAKAFAQAIGEKPNRLIFSGKAQTLPSEQEILRDDRPIDTDAPREVAPAPARTPAKKPRSR